MRIALAYIGRFIDVSGGIERVLCNFANAMVERGHQVSIIYCYIKSGVPFYPLDQRVALYNLMAVHPEKWKKDLDSSISLKTKLVREGIRLFSKSSAREWNENAKGKLIREDLVTLLSQIQPDVILSARYGTSNYLLNIVKTHVPVITMFHTDANEAMPGMPWGELMALEKSRYAQVLLKKDIPVVKRYCPDANIIQIPNAVPQYNCQANLAEKKETFRIIHMGRLARIKRQHLLIEAFARLANDFPNWIVELWGGDSEGSYERKLRALVNKYGLQTKILLKGKSTRVANVYMNGDLFVFPSKFEGFPLAMTEAMSAGLPVIAFRSCSSAAELIHSEKDGLLVNDGVEALAEGMRDLMQDQGKRVIMGQAAEESMKNFAPEKIWDQWEFLLQGIAD